MRKHSGEGTIKYDNGDVYVGEFKDAEPHGVGKMTYKNGRASNGLWEDGDIEYDDELYNDWLAQGKVKMKYCDGTYEGEWGNGKKHGKGTIKWSDGDSYEGDWKHDKRHGKGYRKYANGYYDGEWKDDKRNGKGTIKFADGESYEGEWKDNKQLPERTSGLMETHTKESLEITNSMARELTSVLVETTMEIGKRTKCTVRELSSGPMEIHTKENG